MLSSGRAARRSVTRSTPTGSVNPNGLPTPSYNCWWSSGVVWRDAKPEARAFEFVFKKCVKGQMIEVTFTAKIRGKKACSAQKGPEGGALRVSGAHASRRSGSHVSTRLPTHQLSRCRGNTEAREEEGHAAVASRLSLSTHRHDQTDEEHTPREGKTFTFVVVIAQVPRGLLSAAPPLQQPVTQDLLPPAYAAMRVGR